MDLHATGGVNINRIFVTMQPWDRRSHHQSRRVWRGPGTGKDEKGEK